MEAVRLGIIGCGVIGSMHLRAAVTDDGIDVAAVADLLPDRVADAAAAHGIAKTYESGDALLEDPDIDAVVLALPANGRTALGLTAFARGKHVLTEKPAAMNAGDLRQLIAAKGDRVGACCCSRFRFAASAAAAADFLAEGRLGELRVVHCRALVSPGPPPTKPPPVWRLRHDLNGGGILANWGCYDLDYLLGILDWQLKPTLVLARAWGLTPPYAAYAAPGSNAETHAAAMILCEGGTMISFERAEFVPVKADHAWQIVGSLGSLRLQMTSQPGKQILFDRPDPEAGVATEVIWEGDDNYDVHRGPAIDFRRAIRGRRPPKTSLEQALTVQQITDAIYASSETGAAVTVNEEA